jgi:hypothetical protein
MVRKVLYPVVFVLAALFTLPAFGTWSFVMVESADPDLWGIDGRFYEHDGLTLAMPGSLVQFIVALGGSEIVDPLEYFDTDMTGALEGAEMAAMTAWVNAGADPAAISGGMNVLATAVNWGGEAELSAPGYLLIDPIAETGSAYSIVPGATFDKIAYRAWNVSKDDLEDFCTVDGVELWYLTGRELESHNNQGGGPDTGWWIGMPGYEGGGAPAPEDWTGLNSLIGWELAAGLRTQYTLDTFLGKCVVPEPGTILLIGGSIVLLLIRRKK